MGSKPSSSSLSFSEFQGEAQFCCDQEPPEQVEVDGPGSRRSLGALSNYKRMKKRKKKSLNLAQPFRSYDRKVVDRGTITVYIFRTTVPKPSSKLYVPASRLAEHAAKNDYTYSIPLQEQFVKHNSDDVIYKITYDDAFHGCSKMSEG